MTYSCSDFTDDILEALAINVPDEHLDNPSRQADLAFDEIVRLQNGLTLAFDLFHFIENDTDSDESRTEQFFALRERVRALQSQPQESKS